MIYTTVYQSPVGDLILGDYQDALCLCDWCVDTRDGVRRRVAMTLGSDYQASDTALLRLVGGLLDQYFAGIRSAFDVPLRMCGTPFQCRVWEALMLIPYGQTITYSALAEYLGDKKAVRAVAAAAKANAISIVVPCHRLVGANSLTGYAGGLPAKKALLDIEYTTYFWH